MSSGAGTLWSASPPSWICLALIGFVVVVLCYSRTSWLLGLAGTNGTNLASVIALPDQGDLSYPLSVLTGGREGNRDSWADHAATAGFRRGGWICWPREHSQLLSVPAKVRTWR